MSLKHIFAQPEYIKGIGNIYPIILRDYDKFQECSSILQISKKHFTESELPLLSLIFLSMNELEFKEKELIKSFEKLFSLVLRKTVKLNANDDIFQFEIMSKRVNKKNNNYDLKDSDDKDNIIKSSKVANKIDFSNYDTLREIIMKQNLIFEPKIYKDPLVQEWANKVLESRAKNSAKISIEDFITTVKNYDGLTYKQIMEQSIYQTYADFYRIGKIMQFEQSSLFATVSSEPIGIQHFAENVDIWKSPYDDLFVDSSKLDKFKGIT